MSKRTVELELATPGLDARGLPVRVPLGVAAAPGATDVRPPEPDLPGEHMLINLGPQHPATHGVFRMVITVDGEVVTDLDPVIGYMHRGNEKLPAQVTLEVPGLKLSVKFEGKIELE